MNPNTCPCCYEDDAYKIDWPYVPSGETPLEPAEGYCSACGFHWSEHCQHPEREQVLRYRDLMRELDIEINWNEIKECDKVLGYI